MVDISNFFTLWRMVRAVYKYIHGMPILFPLVSPLTNCNGLLFTFVIFLCTHLAALYAWNAIILMRKEYCGMYQNKYSSMWNTKGGGLINFCDFRRPLPPLIAILKNSVFFLKLKLPYLLNHWTYIHNFSTKLLNSTSSTKHIGYLS